MTPFPALADGGSSVTCTDGATRPRRDCEAEATDLDRRLDPLLEKAARLPRQRGLRAAVVDALRGLRLARVQFCRDWNVCALSPEQHSARLASLDRELSAAARLLDLFERRRRDGQAALSAWAAGLESRLSAGAVRTPATPVVAATPRVTPQVLELIARLQQQIAGVEAARPLLARVRDEVSLPANGSPPSACRGDSTLRADLSSGIRAGGPQSYSLGSLRHKLDEICEAFTRWLSPDEGLVAREMGFVEHIGRVEGWMHDIRACVRAEGWSRHCQNNYGAEPARAVEQVERALALLAEARAALEDVPGTPFPCRSRVWAHLSESQFEGRIVRINVPRIGADAQRLCHGLGVDTETLNQKVQRIREEIARTLASLTQQANGFRTSLRQIRASYHISQ